MIELSNITKQFNGVTAVDDVDLSVASGEFFTLLGPSGCGKTTLLRIIGGFDAPDAGEFQLDGQNMTATPPYQRPVNQVFQSYALFPHLTVEQNIAFGLKMAGVPRDQIYARVADALRLVSLIGLERRKPSQLSGGQKQRVALARALVNRPKVLLLDEPLAALDAKLRQSVQLELKQIQRELGITFVFVTHDQDEAMILSDRIGVMDAGRVLQVGSPRDIYERPNSLTVARFVGQSNVLMTVPCDDNPGLVRTPGGLQLTVREPAKSAMTLVIRPQSVQRCEQDQAQFAATISQIIFRGETVHYVLSTLGGEQLVASGWQSDTAFTVGQQIGCRIEPESILCFARE